MNGVTESETVLSQLSRQEKWQIARWLLKELEGSAQTQSAERQSAAAGPLPDYAARRRRIFGEKVLPNLVLTARAQERW